MGLNTEKTLIKILGILENLDTRLERIEAEVTKQCISDETKAPPTPAQRKQSIREFLLERAPSSNTEKTLAIGYFLEINEGIDSFNKADLEAGYRSAKEQLPSNINAFVNQSIKNGHMMEAREKKNSKKAWTITSTGERYILNGFNKLAKEK